MWLCVGGGEKKWDLEMWVWKKYNFKGMISFFRVEVSYLPCIQFLGYIVGLINWCFSIVHLHCNKHFVISYLCMEVTSLPQNLKYPTDTQRSYSILRLLVKLCVQVCISVCHLWEDGKNYCHLSKFTWSGSKKIWSPLWFIQKH